jgi:hypothetical protein
MSVERNRAIVRRLFEVWNIDTLDAIEELPLIVLPFQLAVASRRVILGIGDRIADRVHLSAALEICLKCTRMPPFSPFFF